MNEDKATPFADAYHEYRCCTAAVAQENGRIEHFASLIVNATKTRDEMEERRRLALVDLERFLTPDAIAELKAVQP